MQLKQTTLSRLKDNQEFRLSKRSDVTYRLVKKEKDGYVFTSTKSQLSFKRSGKTKVFITQ